MSRVEMTTEDTGERVAVPALPSRGCGDGYDWMEAVGRGWSAVPGWGRDGWDLGSWPYVIVLVHKGKDDGGLFWAVAVYCEGDVEVAAFRTLAATHKHITKTAFFCWKQEGDGPPGLPESAEDLPEDLTVPYGWGA